MFKRVDTASRQLRASAATIYAAFASPYAMAACLPPQGMKGTMLKFDFREGGGYRMRLTYEQPGHGSGKTSEDTDEVEVRFRRLVPDERIEESVTFESEEPAFAGEMRIVWSLEPNLEGTLVTVRCEDVPEGIPAEDHEDGLSSTLEILAAFVERDR